VRALIVIALFGGLTAFGVPPLAHSASPQLQFHASSERGWHYVKEDPKTKKKLAVINAKSWERTSNPFLFKLNAVTGSVYNPGNSSYSNLNFQNAMFDEKSGTLISGQKLAIINIP
jgi:hypothetical protein